MGTYNFDEIMRRIKALEEVNSNLLKENARLKKTSTM